LFYNVASETLYYEIELPDIDLRRLGVGLETKTILRPTRRSQPSRNMKKALFDEVRVLTLRQSDVLGYLGPCPLSIIPVLPRLQTLRIHRLRDDWYSFDNSDWSSPDDYDTVDWGEIHSLVKQFPAKKVVLVFPSCRWYFPSFGIPANFTRPNVLTLVISLDCLLYLGHPGRWLVESPMSAHSPQQAQLRIILTGYGEINPEEMDPDSGIHTVQIALFIEDLLSTHYHTTVYVVDGGRMSSHAEDRWDLPSTYFIEELLNETREEEDMACELRGSFTLKTRRDYIMEGWSDEIDPEELAIWNKLEDRAQKAEECRRKNQEQQQKRSTRDEETSDAEHPSIPQPLE
jgi:hypothetical protein